MGNIIERIEQATQKVKTSRKNATANSIAVYKSSILNGDKKNKRIGLKHVIQKLDVAERAIKGIRAYQDLPDVVENYVEKKKSIQNSILSIHSGCENLIRALDLQHITPEKRQAANKTFNYMQAISDQLDKLVRDLDEFFWKAYLREKTTSSNVLIHTISEVFSEGKVDERYNALSSMQYKLLHESSAEDASQYREELDRYLAQCQAYIHSYDGIDDEIQSFLMQISQREIGLNSLTPNVIAWLNANNLMHHIHIKWA